MANLNEIAELSWRTIYPNPTDETAVTREEFITTAKTQYALQMWVMARNERNQEGVFEIPSQILAQSEPLPVVNNEIDISKLKILKGLPNGIWLQNIGGLTCDCEYIRSTVNLSQILCGEDSLPEMSKPFLIIGEKIIFPNGTHNNKLPIIYATDGVENDGTYEVDDVVGAIIQEKLLQLYGTKQPEDKTNNGSSNN